MANVWIEKTLSKNKSQEFGLGSSLWSPVKDLGGGDAYSNMRKIKRGDVVFHLIDNEFFAGVSIVESEKKNFICPSGEWKGREGYFIQLKNFIDFRESHEEIQRKDLLNKINAGILLEILNDPHEGKLFYNKDLNLNQGAYISLAPPKLVNLILKEFHSKNGHYPPYFVDYLADQGGSQVQEANNGKINENFVEYLKEQGFLYDIKTVENFLLSIKVKPFVILTGGTGTGKTKLAQAYGKYISKTPRKQKIIHTEVSVGKSDINGGWTISREDFISAVPEAGKFDGEYKITVDGEVGKGRLSLAPRIFFDRNGKIKDHLEKLKNDGEKKRVGLELYLGGPDTDSSDNDNYRIIPVGSNWNENRHIVGFENVITKEYYSPPALKLMLRAEKDPQTPYLMILDEMNLSHVERYFSDLLSAMESGDPIELHDKSEDNAVPHSVKVPSNLIIIGTVNMDETTYMFSPKVLDRANVIEFKATTFTEYLNMNNRKDVPSGDFDFILDTMKGFEVREMKAPDIVSFLKEKNVDVSEMIGDIEFFQSTLSKINLSFSFRTMDEIMRFMYVSFLYDSKNFKSNWHRYLDAQIMQKILPKVHGNKNIEGTLMDLSDCYNKKIGNSGEYAYPESKDKIERMLEQLKTQRYVSFTS